jgi:predicted nucleotidyltransferase
MRKLNIDLGELLMAFGDDFPHVEHYLDKATGRIISFDREICAEIGYERESEEDEEDLESEEGDETPDILPMSSENGGEDWRMAEYRMAQEVDADRGNRYLEIPGQDSRNDFRDMEAFVETVENTKLRKSLGHALEGRGPFRRFKEVLSGDFRERERWFEFKEVQTLKRVLRWLEDEEIEPIGEVVTVEGYLQKRRARQKPVRPVLIKEVLEFVKKAKNLTGVQRIALIGSLTTAEPNPKDADLLVTVADDVDLTDLAKLGRQLAGRAQQINRGGEVFLADPQGNYLGRTCHWKECGLGFRTSCDALHCGGRHYLHDDLKTVKLPKSLIQEPPLELWPLIVARVPLPEDVKKEIVEPLQKGENT